MSDRFVLWLVRVLWAALPLTVGPLVADGLDLRSAAVRWTLEIGLWVVWGAGLLAVAVPHPIGLTALRLGATATVGAAVWAAFAADVSAITVVGLGAAFVTASATFAPAIADAAVNGAAYGDERRLLLRAPAPLLLGPIPAAGVVAVAGLTAGPLLLASRQWVAGGVVCLVGLPTAAVAIRALHALGLRWVVFVPAGLVIHDRAALREPVLFRRAAVAAIGPAPVDTSATDLTQQAPGLCLEMALAEPTVIVRRVVRGGAEAPETTEAVLFTPTRPGRVLAVARERRLAG